MPPATANRTCKAHFCYRLPLAAMLLSGVAFQASAHDLPLGDGKVSSGPKVGYVFSCQQRFNPNAPGAQASGDWLGKTTWNPEKKPYVRGSVSWPSAITIQVEGSERVVRANNLPSHPTGIFPIQRDDPAYQYDRNPGRITEQDIVLKLPAVPSAAAKPSCVPMGMVGFSTTNVAIFNALDARGDDAPAHEIQDKCGGHPQQTGQYHYHNLSPCLEDARSQSGGHSDLVAYAADGFGLFGKYGANGKQVTNADLDGCHGHSHTIEWDGTAQNIYHYHMTEAYPYTVGCFKGTPVSLPDTGMGLQGGQQQRPAPGQGGQRGQGGGQGGPQQALATAAAELGVSANQLRRALGPPPPNFQSAARKLGISADRIRRAMQNARGR